MRHHSQSRSSFTRNGHQLEWRSSRVLLARDGSTMPECSVLCQDSSCNSGCLLSHTLSLLHFRMILSRLATSVAPWCLPQQGQTHAPPRCSSTWETMLTS